MTDSLKKGIFILAFVGLGMGMSCGKKGPPSIPIKLKETAFSSFTASHFRGGIILEWEESRKLPAPVVGRWLGYRLLRQSQGEDFVELDTVDINRKAKGFTYQYIDLPPQPEVEYAYMVQLLSEDDRVGSVTEEIRITPAGGPSPPSGLRAGAGDGQIELAWAETPAGDGMAGVLAGYNLFRRTLDGEYDLRAALNPEPIPVSGYTDTGLENGEEYCYVITSVLQGEQGFEESGLSLETCAVPRDTTPPAAPEGLSHTRGTGFLLLSWDENSEEDLAGYRVYRRQGREGSFDRLTPEVLANPFYKDSGVRSGEFYSYVVTAVDSSPAANESPFSETFDITIP
jgi:hypothetical protein